VVAVAFAVATFSWGLAFYSLGVYLVELNRRHGWPISFISFAFTAYYVAGGVLVTFVGDLFARFGPRRTVLAGVAALGGGVLAVATTGHPWQLYAALGLMALGWTGMGGAAINAIVAPWFVRRRGLALSLALNGASCGGIVMVPAWTFLLARMDFVPAAAVVVGGMACLLVPMVALVLHDGPAALGLHPDGDRAAPARPSIEGAGGGAVAGVAGRGDLLRSAHFWSIALPFALALLAQVGFITHQVAFLTPRVGREGAALAVSLTAVAAMAGRVGTGFFIDRIDRRLATAGNVALQATALGAMIAWPSVAVLYAGCVLFGLGVGNLITFPALIVQREYPAADFNRVASLVLAICQFAFAFGPGVLGWARDHWGSYAAALAICVACEVGASLGVLVRVRAGTAPRAPAAAA
jgi:MFS family permease